ncbi:MAG: extracellular solute-binding protein [Candidatus Pacebacteria bacterium]|nr:extracellular solute-binding protein [Candidatus Paceibacterota bacterium]
MNPFANMRPFQVIIIIIFALLAFIGLYLFSTFSGFGNTSNKIGSVAIWGTLPASAVQEELNTLTSGNKEYSKVTYIQKSAASFDQDLSDAIASGSGPDMIIISQEQLLDETNKLNVIPFSSLPQRTFINTYLPEYTLYLNSSGTFGIPYVLDPLVLYYNKSITLGSGVASAPKTWETITGLAPTLTKVNPDQSIAQSTIDFGQYNNVDNARGILSLLFLQSGASITTSNANGVRSSLATSNQNADGTSAATSALSFYTQFADPTRTVYSWNASFDEARNVFIAGNLAFYVGYASEEAQLKAANPNLNFDMAQIPQPQTSAYASDYALAYAFAIPKASKNPTGAYETAIALTGKDVLPTAAQALGMAPAVSSLLVVSPTDLYAPVFYPEALISEGWLSPSPGTTDGIFSAMISNVTSGRYQARDAITMASQALDAALP